VTGTSHHFFPQSRKRKKRDGKRQQGKGRAERKEAKRRRGQQLPSSFTRLMSGVVALTVDDAHSCHHMVLPPFSIRICSRLSSSSSSLFFFALVLPFVFLRSSLYPTAYSLRLQLYHQLKAVLHCSSVSFTPVSIGSCEAPTSP
jgi:hypothetical protein